VVTVRGAANFVELAISFMGPSPHAPGVTTKDGDLKDHKRPLRPFAGMTRIRFKGFGFSPSQPRSGRPSSKTRTWLLENSASIAIPQAISFAILKNPAFGFIARRLRRSGLYPPKVNGGRPFAARRRAAKRAAS
jgi:hypothetical protein